MPIDNPKNDVAISFLSEDQTTAAAIYSKLSEGLKVFFYPRNQETSRPAMITSPSFIAT
jgi:hypothetical protein